VSAARPLPQRKSDRKLQLILERAAGVFARKGFEGASMRDLSRSTGISLAGLYHYVSSKQQLLHRIQMDAFSRILESLHEHCLERRGTDCARLPCSACLFKTTPLLLK
jgi:AcrR family transcriptional regulator